MFQISQANALEKYFLTNQQYYKNDVHFIQSIDFHIQQEFVNKKSVFSFALQLLKFNMDFLKLLKLGRFQNFIF